jgi:hypothetical protein
MEEASESQLGPSLQDSMDEAMEAPLQQFAHPLKMGTPMAKPLFAAPPALPHSATMQTCQKSWTPLSIAWHPKALFGMSNPLSVTSLLGNSGLLQQGWANRLKCCCKDIFDTAPPIKWHASRKAGYGPMLLNKEKCYARTWAGGWGMQCTHKRKKSYFFCRSHRTEDCRPHGEYCSAPRPAHKFAQSPALCVDGQPPMKKYRRSMPAEAKVLPIAESGCMFMSHYIAFCHKNLWDKSLFDTLKGYVSYTAQTKPQQLKLGLAHFLETPLGEIGADPEAAICWLSWYRYDGSHEPTKKIHRTCNTLLNKLSDLRAGLKQAGVEGLPQWARATEPYGAEVAQIMKVWATEDLRCGALPARKKECVVEPSQVEDYLLHLVARHIAGEDIAALDMCTALVLRLQSCTNLRQSNLLVDFRWGDVEFATYQGEKSGVAKLMHTKFGTFEAARSVAEHNRKVEFYLHDKLSYYLLAHWCYY